MTDSIEVQGKKIGRIAFRVEGDNWVAYYALTDTMDDALFLGSVRMALVENKTRKDEFITLMRNIVSDLIEDGFGKRPTWSEPEPAPEHERARRA